MCSTKVLQTIFKRLDCLCIVFAIKKKKKKKR